MKRLFTHYVRGALALFMVVGLTLLAQAQPPVNFSWELYDGPNGTPDLTNFDTITHPTAFGTSRFGSVSLGDLDGDGDKDFISGSRIGQFYFYRNIGTVSLPKFERQPLATLDSIKVAPTQNLNECRPILVDIDNDNDLDLVASARYDYNGFNFLNDLQYFENIGSASNPVFQWVSTGIPGLHNQQIGEFCGGDFADMDDDGDLDLVIGGSDSCTYFRNDGTVSAPNFTRGFGINNPMDGWNDNSFLAPTISMKDLDRDGDYDLYFGNEAGFVRMLENVGTPTAMAWGSFTTAPAHNHLDTVDFGSFIAIDIEDVTNDGFEDLVVCSFQPSTYWLYTARVACNDTSVAISLSECDSFTVPSGGATYYTSGTYADTIPRAAGCDSIMQITVTILNSTSGGPVNVTACDSYTIGSVTYTTSGSYIDTLTNAAGCDSLVTVNLTINNSTSETLNITQCNPYTVPSGNATYSMTGTYMDTILNAANCDSIITINLTISDLVPPTAVCQNVTVYLDGSGTASITAADIDGGSTDDCSPTVTLSASNTNFDCSDLAAPVSVSLFVSDPAGNADTCTANVTVLDTISPVASCQNIDVYLDATGNASITAADVNNGSSDNCTTPTVTIDVSSFTCANVGANNVVLTATDGSSNTGTCTAVVTVIDTISPQITCPSSFTDTANTAGCMAAVTWSMPVISDNCSGLFINTGNATGGTYALGTNNVVITVEDASGNTTSCNFDVTVVNDLTVNVDSSSNVSCNGAMDATISVTATGINAPYTYDWDNDGTGDNDDAQDLTGVNGGNYTLVVTDNAGCTASTSGSVSEPSAVVVTVDGSTDPSGCGLADGGAMITVTGGTPTYSFDWDNDGTGDTDDVEDITGLAAGSYIVTVYDANGCNDSASVSLTDPNGPTFTVDSVTNVDCFGNSTGAIFGTTSGGVMPYTYDWDNDGTGDNDDTEDLSALAMGTYNVTVTDNNGCTTTGMATISEPTQLVAIIDSVMNTSCNGSADGEIMMSVTGGTTTYTYDWDNDGTGDNDDNEDLVGLMAGIYQVVVTDANGCVDSASATITEPAPLMVMVDTAVNVSCNGGADGEIMISVSGGTMAYMYDWDNDGTGDNDDAEDLTGLMAGAYQVVVTDANGCVDSADATLTEPTAISLSVTSSDEINGADGSTDLTVSGGTAPYTYDWDNDGLGDNDDTEDLTGLVGMMTYIVWVTDANGCMDSTSIFVDSQVSIRELENALAVSVYPNPSRGQLTVELDQATTGVMDIYSVDGKLIVSESVNNRRVIAVDLNEQERGMYLMRLTTAAGTVNRTLIIK